MGIEENTDLGVFLIGAVEVLFFFFSSFSFFRNDKIFSYARFQELSP